MRTLTRMVIVLLLLATATAAPAFAQSAGSLGGSVVRYRVNVIGIGVEVTLATYRPNVDAQGNVTSWELTKPEATWASTWGTYPEVSDMDYTRVYIQIPGFGVQEQLRGIKRVGLSLDQNANNVIFAQQETDRGFYVDLPPGKLPVGTDTIFPFCQHENDKEGVSFFGIINAEWAADGNVATGFHIGCVPVPAKYRPYYYMLDEIFRNLVRDKTFRISDPSSRMPKEATAEIDAMIAQIEAEKARQAAQAAQQQVLQSGTVCSFCYSLNPQRPAAEMMHQLARCPSLYHPQVEEGVTAVSPPAITVAPALTPAPPAPAPAPVARAAGPAIQMQQRRQSLAIHGPGAAVQPAAPLASVDPVTARVQGILSRNPYTPGTGKLIVVLTDASGQPVRTVRGYLPQLNLCWPTGNQVFNLRSAEGIASFASVEPGSVYTVSVVGTRASQRVQIRGDQPTIVYLTL